MRLFQTHHLLSPQNFPKSSLSQNQLSHPYPGFLAEILTIKKNHETLAAICKYLRTARKDSFVSSAFRSLPTMLLLKLLRQRCTYKVWNDVINRANICRVVVNFPLSAYGRIQYIRAKLNSAWFRNSPLGWVFLAILINASRELYLRRVSSLGVWLEHESYYLSSRACN